MCFVVVVEFFVVLVRYRTMKMKKNLKKMKRNLRELSGSVVVLHLALLEHESLCPVFGILMPNQVPLPVVECCQTHPLVVVRQLAYGWQFSLQRQLVWLLNLRTWIQSCLSDLRGLPLVGCRRFEFPEMLPYEGVLGLL